MKTLLFSYIIFFSYIRYGLPFPDPQESYAASLGDASVGLYGKSSYTNLRPGYGGYSFANPRPNSRGLLDQFQGVVYPNRQPYASRPFPHHSSSPKNGYGDNPPSRYGANPPSEYGANPANRYIASPPRGYGASPPRGYGARPPNGYGTRTARLDGYRSPLVRPAQAAGGSRAYASAVVQYPGGSAASVSNSYADGSRTGSESVSFQGRRISRSVY